MVLCSAVRAASNSRRWSACVMSCCRRSCTTQSNGRYYTKKHEWVSVDAGVGTVGISNYAQEALGEVVFVQLPAGPAGLAGGAVVSAGDECGALESVKAASEVYSPVSGTITEVNNKLESTPSLINKSCYSEGWLFRVRLSSPDELHRLMDEAAYDTYLKDH